MSFLILFIFLFSSLSVIAQEETIVFIDTNNNKKEIEVARKKANELGKNLVVYPENGEEFDLKKAEKVLQNNNFETLIVSGHNGGGSISGDNGAISYTDIQSILKNYNRDNVKTVMLLGCNTSNPNQIMKWKGIFPNLNLIAGYNGTAPAGDKIAGHSYINEILEKKDDLYRHANTKDLERALNNLKHIFYLEAGIYINKINCNEEQDDRTEFIFRPIIEDKKDRFKEFNFKECEEKKELLIKEHLVKYFEYFEGQKQITSEEDHENLRLIYNFFHQYSHCYEEFEYVQELNSYIPNWNQVGLMRFWQETKDNAFYIHKDQFDHFFKTLDQFKSEEGLKRLESLHKTSLEKELKIQKQNLSISRKEHLSRLEDILKNYKETIERKKKDYEDLEREQNKQMAIFSRHPSFSLYLRELQAEFNGIFISTEELILRQKNFLKRNKDRFNFSDETMELISGLQNRTLKMARLDNETYSLIDKESNVSQLKVQLENLNEKELKNKIQGSIESITKRISEVPRSTKEIKNISEKINFKSTEELSQASRKDLKEVLHTSTQIYSALVNNFPASAYNQFQSSMSVVDDLYNLNYPFSYHEEMDSEERELLRSSASSQENNIDNDISDEFDSYLENLVYATQQF